MTEVQVDLDMALKFWWAQTWRALPLGVLVGAICSVAFMLFCKVAGVDPQVKLIMNIGLGMVVGLIMYLWILQRLFKNGFGGYRLVLVRKDENAG